MNSCNNSLFGSCIWCIMHQCFSVGNSYKSWLRLTILFKGGTSKETPKFESSYMSSHRPGHIRLSIPDMSDPRVTGYIRGFLIPWNPRPSSPPPPPLHSLRLQCYPKVILEPLHWVPLVFRGFASPKFSSSCTRYSSISSSEWFLIPYSTSRISFP
jgi:hypothetical protein